MKGMEELAAEKASELKAKLADADSRRHVAESQVGELKAEVKAAHVAADRIVEEYKKSEDFKGEVTKGYIEFSTSDF